MLLQKSDFRKYPVLIILCLIILYIPAEAEDYSVAVLRDDSNIQPVTVADTVTPYLKQNGFSVETVSYETLENRDGLTEYDCLVVTEGTAFPLQGNDNLEDFLGQGGDVVLLGGINFKNRIHRTGAEHRRTAQNPETPNLPSLAVFEDRDIYYFEKAPTITTYEKQDILESKASITGSYSGISAVAFEYPEISEYIPLLAVQDKFSRNIGFAAGLLVNYAGNFKNSYWLISGITSPEFYHSEIFLNAFTDVLGVMKKGKLAGKIAEKAKNNEEQTLSITSPAPKDFIRLSEDKKHFLLPNGKKFFALGCNYIGPFERKCEYGEDYFNLERLETDFRKAKQAGINAFRFWGFRIEQYPERLKTIIELARKYRIYLLLVPRLHPLPSDEQLMDVFRKYAAIVNNETIVLGYDLMNEPYITTVGSVSIDGEKSAILKHRVYENYSEKYFDKDWVDEISEKRSGWPELGDWIDTNDARELYAAYSMAKKYIEKYNSYKDYSCLYGLKDKLPIEDEYKEFFSALNRTFEDWILFHKKAVRQLDTRHFITAGYNTFLQTLDANRLLDFVSHHIYKQPYSYKDMRKSVTTYDRLRAYWQNKPITMGEFGFTSGLKISDDRRLKPYAASIAEMMVYLYAFANDYSGAFLWMLSEWTVANIEYNAPWISKDKHLYESRFGMYYYDGTSEGSPKPIAHATKFFRKYIDAHEPGEGNFKLVKAETPVKTGYVFTDKDALFIGNTEYQSERLKFTSPLPVNVMLQWDNNRLNIMATADVEVRVNLSEFGFDDVEELRTEGACAEITKNDNTVELDLLEGRIITFYKNKL